MAISKMDILAGGGAAAACAACCAAGMLPASALAFASVSGASFAEWGEKGLILAVVGLGSVFLVSRWLRPAAPASHAGCGCGPSSSVKEGASCPAPTSTN